MTGDRGSNFDGPSLTHPMVECLLMNSKLRIVIPRQFQKHRSEGHDFVAQYSDGCFRGLSAGLGHIRYVL